MTFLKFSEKGNQEPIIPVPDRHDLGDIESGMINEYDIPDELPDLETARLEVAKDERKDLIEYKHHIIEKPIYLETNKLREILGSITTIKNKVKDTTSIVELLKEIKDNQEKVMDDFYKSLEDIEKKLVFIDKTCFR